MGILTILEDIVTNYEDIVTTKYCFQKKRMLFWHLKKNTNKEKETNHYKLLKLNLEKFIPIFVTLLCVYCNS